VVEGARLESEYTSKAYRGFESLPLRHPVSTQASPVETILENGAVPRLLRNHNGAGERANPSLSAIM
jgi:hypothetical protein